MAVYRSHKGRLVDMDALRVQNEKEVASGNMGVNARGDKLGKNGEIIETVAQRARAKHRRKTTVRKGSLKPANTDKVEDLELQEPDFDEVAPVEPEQPKPKTTRAKRASKTIDKSKEVELDDGSIEISEDKEE